MSNPTIERFGNWEYTDFEGKEWKRRVGTTQWIEQDGIPPAEPPPTILHLVRQDQAPGEPDHWAIFLAYEGERGTVLQVKGDAVAMRYHHAEKINIMGSSSYKDAYMIAELNNEQVARVHYWATHETPPSAPDQAAVHENCQGWTIRVIGRLVAEGIVQQKWLDFAVDIKQPVS